MNYIFDVKIFWTETKGSRQKEQDIFQKGVDNKEKKRSVFLKILHEKQIYKKNCSKKREKQKFFKNETEESKIFFVIFPKTERQFFKRPKKEEW